MSYVINQFSLRIFAKYEVSWIRIYNLFVNLVVYYENTNVLNRLDMFSVCVEIELVLVSCLHYLISESAKPISSFIVYIHQNRDEIVHVY